jgi:hypothetical protein
MECVLDVYKRPYDADYPIVCMDECPKQLIETLHEPIPVAPGRDKRVDYDYVRHGVVNIFMANEPLRGNRILEVTESKKKKDWALFIKRIDEQYPSAKKITLVMDNYATHKAASLYETFEPTEAKRIWDRFEFVFTPVHGSWLNMAEIELHVLSGQCLKRHLSNIDLIKKEIEAWTKNRNNKTTRINWQFTNGDARIKLKRLYPSIDA